jgi:hypothetical protein
MVQSVALACVEIEKKLTLQRHCPLSSSSIQKKNLISLAQLFKFWIYHTRLPGKHLSVYCWRSQHPPRAKKRPYLPRYRRTAPLSTYTYTTDSTSYYGSIGKKDNSRYNHVGHSTKYTWPVHLRRMSTRIWIPVHTNTQTDGNQWFFFTTLLHLSSRSTKHCHHCRRRRGVVVLGR